MTAVPFIRRQTDVLFAAGRLSCRLTGIAEGVGRERMAADTSTAFPIGDLVRGADIGTYEFRADLNLLLWSAEQRHLFGVDAAPASPAEVFQLIHPDDRARVEAYSYALAESSEASYSHSFRITRPDGLVRVILDRGTIQRTATGQISLIRGINLDITSEAQQIPSSEGRLRADERRYRTLFDAIDEGFCIVEVRHDTPDGRIDYRVIEANPAFHAKTGLPENILNAWLRSAAPGLEDHWFETYGLVARTGQPTRFENHSHHLGRWFDVYAFPFDDPRDCHVAILFNDITDRKRDEERSRLLVEEINHRSKNTLGIVQAIARLSATSSPNGGPNGGPNGATDDFLPRFGERVRALAASHDLLVRNKWHSASLADLLKTQLAPFDGPSARRIITHGPPVALGVVATKALGMAFHELATNCVKYGALSNAAGRVAVTWSIADSGKGGTSGGEPTFHLVWRESDGPDVAYPERQGFGTTVTTRMTEESTGGRVTTEFLPEGFIWRFTCPLDAIHH